MKRFITREISLSMRDEARDMLDRELGVGRLGEACGKDLADALSKSLETAALLSREQHYKAVALAYAAYIQSKIDSDFRDVVNDLAEHLGITLKKNTDPLSLFLRARIFYGEDEKDSRRSYSRDVAAINYLMSEKIGPNGLLSRAAEDGEGLDQWSRRSASRKERRSDRYSKRERALKKAGQAVFSEYPDTIVVLVSSPEHGFFLHEFSMGSYDSVTRQITKANVKDKLRLLKKSGLPQISTDVIWIANKLAATKKMKA